MTDTTKPLRDARKRVDAYLDRHSKAKGLDPDSIHGFDGGLVCFGAELLASDLRTLLARMDAAEGALADAATSLETISRLAGRDTHSNGDATCMGTFSEVRGYAISRATSARAALTKGA